MKLDILVFAVHPDDAELGCSGTILKHIAAGKKVGIIDLTRGELGTRGTAETRDQESADSSRILGIHVRENLGMRDGFFKNDEEHQLKIIQVIRKYNPEIVLSNALYDRHSDHGRGGDLVNDAVFLGGLAKIKTELNGVDQGAFRPRLLLQYIQDRYIKPDILIDKGGEIETISYEPLQHVQQPMIERVVKYFRGESENLCSAADGLEVMKMIDAITVE